VADPSRQHVYAFLSDLTTCWLLKVNASFKQSFALNCVTTDDVQMATFTWYDPALKRLTGLEVLAKLGSLSPEELGMSSMYQLDRPVELRSLGTSASSDVYELCYTDVAKDITVLKVAKAGSEQLDAETAALEFLNNHFRDCVEQLKHVPAILAPTSLATRHIRIRPVAVPLTNANIEHVHVSQLFQALKATHSSGWLHGDLSHGNLMLAPSGWRTRETVEDDGDEDTYEYGSDVIHRSGYRHHCANLCNLTTCFVALTPELLLVDWGFAGRQDDTSFKTVKGTPFTMSQQTLLHSMDDTPAGEYFYSVADELEAAAKSLLLILLPSLKRCIQQQVNIASQHRRGQTSVSTLAVLQQCWEAVLSKTLVLELCAACDYQGLQAWFVNHDLFFCG
jgi:hypothetical protein